MKIKYLKFEDVNRDHQPYLDKNGRPFYRASMKVEGNENWLSGFAYSEDPMRKWKVGDDVEIVITPKDVNGKTYYNFQTPKKTFDNSKVWDKLAEQKIEIDTLKAKVVDLEGRISVLAKSVEDLANVNSVDNEIPF